MTQKAPNRMLSTREAAEILKMPQKEVLRRIRTEDIQATKFGWVWQVSTSEIERIKRSNWYKRIAA